MGFNFGNTAKAAEISRKTFSDPKRKGVEDRPKLSTLLPGRVSQPDYDDNYLGNLGERYKVINPDFLTEIIPLIRSLSHSNPDVSQAVQNIVALGNTGHKVFFDRRVSEAQVDEMRNHLSNKRKLWAPGQAGMDGVVNKMFSQALIGGAISGEWVINPLMNGIQSYIFLRPENIRFKLGDDKVTYKPYQKVPNAILPNIGRTDGDLIKLNPDTFKYLAINGDTESPYGIPPYLPAVKRIESQDKMNVNIDYICDVMGLIGFLEVLVGKPDQEDYESEAGYTKRLESLLVTAKTRVGQGLKDGVVVGFKDDHEFDFKSASKNFDQVTELYKNNELQIATALKQDAALWGRDYGTSESKANITFMKMLSELRNIQNIVKTNLEFGYELELRLAGFEFDYLKVQFKRSTIQDDYKYQQSEEIKIRNVLNKLAMGMINQEQAADELDYESPALAKTLIPLENLIGKSGPGAAGSKEKRKEGKATDKRKSRQNNKPINKVTK